MIGKEVKKIFKMNYTVELIDKKIAKDLIIKNHYSHKWTSCRYALGLFDGGDLIGVAIYGFPVGRQVVKSISPILCNNDVLELTRLWIDDSGPKNTESFFIGKTFKWLRNNTNVKVLVSYSDPMYNHKGTIYQATNWIYQGNGTMLVKGYLHVINGQVMHPRSVVALYGTTKESELVKIDNMYSKIEMKKKHRYIYILDRKSRREILRSLKHPQLEYPRDNNNCEWF